jgi:predicted amidohydrolase YtcJ
MKLKPGFGDDLFRVNGVKVWADGSAQAKTAYLREPYLNDTSRGTLTFSLEKLTPIVQRAHKAGWQIGCHASGDAAIDTAVAAYENALRETPRNDHRHRIEYCTLLHDDQVAKMKALGLSPSFLTGHIRKWGLALRDEILGAERAKQIDPCASALKAGLRISLHSDFNVTSIQPLRVVEDAVARVMQQSGEVLNPDERIDVMAALRAVTLDAAWQCRMDDIAGSLEPGKYADLVILEQDPTAVEPTKIRAIKISETWLQGERRFPA